MSQSRIFEASTSGQSAQVKPKRPKWNDVFNNYPKNGMNDIAADEVFKMVFGDNYPSEYRNACATRLSMGLIGAGIDIPVGYKAPEGKQGIYLGKRIIVSVEQINIFLEKKFGIPDITIPNPKNLDKLKNKKGIYIMLPRRVRDKYDNNGNIIEVGFGATGHATLWNGSGVIGKDYIAAAATIRFWELQ